MGVKEPPAPSNSQPNYFTVFLLLSIFLDSLSEKPQIYTYVSGEPNLRDVRYANANASRSSVSIIIFLSFFPPKVMPVHDFLNEQSIFWKVYTFCFLKWIEFLFFMFPSVESSLLFLSMCCRSTKKMSFLVKSVTDACTKLNALMTSKNIVRNQIKFLGSSSQEPI